MRYARCVTAIDMPLLMVKSRDKAARTDDHEQAAACAQLLLRALVEADGDAAVLQAGERPYLVAPAGAIRLASVSLTPASVERLIDQLLPGTAKGIFSASGLAQAECAIATLPFERFTVAATRSIGELRLELHRLRVPDYPFSR